MSEHWYRRIDERDEGRRRLRRLTGWTAATGVALSGIFGIALASCDRAAAASTDQNQVTNNTGDDGNNPNLPGSNGGSVIQPPAQPPAPTHGSGHVSSGGS
jgi:hypothetical protein